MIINYRLSSEISFVQWDNDTVIYNHGSACTHLISDVPVELWEIVLSGQAFSFSQLLEVIENVFLDYSSKERKRFVNDIKTQMLSIELIETF